VIYDRLVTHLGSKVQNILKTAPMKILHASKREFLKNLSKPKGTVFIFSVEFLSFVGVNIKFK
jgi:hypothetical protein